MAEEDEKALAAFMHAPAAQSRTLGDLILERLRASGAPLGGDHQDGQDGAGCVPGDMEPAVVEVYRGVGALLSRYKSGKVPKAFKIIPALANWEEVLYLTQPEAWTPHATMAATRLFASNLNAKMAQRFFNLVLLPRVRADVQQNRRLHFTLFCALKKATYKPAAFFKGLLLPLCQAGNCTLREAVIMSSVLQRTSIPMLHSAAALLKIVEMEYSGTNRRVAARHRCPGGALTACGPAASSFACCWTRSTRCRTACWTRWWSTSCASRRTRARCRWYGTTRCSPLCSATSARSRRRTSSASRRCCRRSATTW